MSVCDQSAEGTLRLRLCSISEQVSSSGVQPFQLCASVSGRSSPERQERQPSVGWLVGCKVTVCIRQRANILLCHRSRPVGEAVIRTRLCLPLQDRLPLRGKLRWRPESPRSPETLMRTARVFGRRRGVFGANAGDCLFACVFSLNSGINIYRTEKQNRVFCLCSLPALLPDDVLLSSCVTNRAP